MRISDWSSDVCSSDLEARLAVVPARAGVADAAEGQVVGGDVEQRVVDAHATGGGAVDHRAGCGAVVGEHVAGQRLRPAVHEGDGLDRQSGVEGTSVSERGDTGGGRRLKKKKEE